MRLVLAPEDKALIVAASAATGASVSSFVLSAALARAEDVIVAAAHRPTARILPFAAGKNSD